MAERSALPVAAVRLCPRPRWPIVLPLVMLIAVLGTLVRQRPADRPEAAALAPGLRVNLNQADAADLRLLPGVGPVTAQRIVTHRRQHGRFTDLEQLQAVHGLGEITIARFAPYATLGLEETSKE